MIRTIVKTYDCDNNNEVDYHDDGDAGNDVVDDVIASRIYLTYYRFTPIFHLSALQILKPCHSKSKLSI